MRERLRAARPSSRVGRWRTPVTVSADGWPLRIASQGAVPNRIRPTSQLIRTHALPCRVASSRRDTPAPPAKLASRQRGVGGRADVRAGCNLAVPPIRRHRSVMRYLTNPMTNAAACLCTRVWAPMMGNKSQIAGNKCRIAGNKCRIARNKCRIAGEGEGDARGW